MDNLDQVQKDRRELLDLLEEDLHELYRERVRHDDEADRLDKEIAGLEMRIEELRGELD